METRYIENFFKVVQQGSLSEAARSLDLSPSAIAQQMRALEKELGTSLLVRHGRKVRPTAAGERLFEKARQLMQECDSLRDWVTSDQDQGQLRLGTLNTVLHSVLPDILCEFLTRHPHVQVHVTVDQTLNLYNALAQDALDVAICLNPGFALPKTICWESLHAEPLVVLCQSKDAHIPALELLRSRPLVQYDRQLAGGKLAERYLQAQNIRTRACLEVNSVIAVSMMVERGVGVGLVPDVGDTLVRGRALHKLQLPVAKGTPPPPARELGFLWHRTSPRLRWTRGLIACAEDVTDLAHRR